MTASSSPRYLVYRLTLQSPLIVASRQGDPNSAATQSFVSGSSIRGIIASRLLGAGVDPESKEFWRLVLSGQVRYLNAYLEIEDERSLPIPLSWRVMKFDRNRGWDLACFGGPRASEVEPVEGEPDWPNEQLEAPGVGYVSPRMSGGSWLVGQPWVDVRIHHQRDRRKGRAWKDQEGREHGAIFAYEFLEPGQSFRGIIQLMEAGEECKVRLRKLLERPVMIGRSRRAGYGGNAKVQFLHDIPREYAGATGLLNRDLEANERFRIVLTSPCIVRDPQTGQVDPACVKAELCRRLGGAVQIERTCCAFETVGGFNRKWGLELPQAWAVQGGSVFVVRALERLDFSKVLVVEHAGLGEQRAEGFGRLMLLEHDDKDGPIRLQRLEARRVGGWHAGAGEAREQQLLDLLEERLVLGAAQQELQRAAFALADRTEKAPAKALLGRLRTLLRHAHDEGTARAALETLSSWINGWEGSDQKAARQLKECKLAGKCLFEWLKALLAADPPSRWEALKQAVGEGADLAVISHKHYLRTQASAERILQEHSATLMATFLDASFGAISRKEIS